MSRITDVGAHFEGRAFEVDFDLVDDHLLEDSDEIAFKYPLQISVYRLLSRATLPGYDQMATGLVAYLAVRLSQVLSCEVRVVREISYTHALFERGVVILPMSTDALFRPATKG